MRLLEVTSAGEEEKEPAESWISAWLPDRLKDVFFTDGDSVQTFISGQITMREKQGRVQAAIRDLLGIDRFRIAAADLEAVYRGLRLEAARSGGHDTSTLELRLEETGARILALEAGVVKLRDRQINMNEQRTAWEKEFRSLRGIGDIDELNERIEKSGRRAAKARQPAPRDAAANAGLVEVRGLFVAVS